MIQATTETNITAYIDVKDNLSGVQTDTTKIRFLVKFINDLDGSVDYSYSTSSTVYDRYTKLAFTYQSVLANVDMFDSEVHLLPAGYYKYEVYEVSWIGTVTVRTGYAPATETDVLSPAADDKGIVRGLITKGKMYLAEKNGTQQVQYTQRQEPSGTNYIYYGQ